MSRDKTIDDVLLVQSLGSNLMSVGKLCDLGMLVLKEINKTPLLKFSQNCTQTMVTSMQTWQVIRLQRIYNFLLFHAIIFSVLDILYALICYFILFLELTYSPRAQCQFLFLSLFLSFAEKEYQTESKWNKTFAMIFLGPEDK